jgi:hypothetical protein
LRCRVCFSQIVLQRSFSVEERKIERSLMSFALAT